MLVVDLPESLPKRNDAFTEVWLAARTYNRSARDGVCYAFEYNSACLVAGEDDASRRDFVEPSRTLYFLQWMHLLYMRTAISAFSERVAELTRETPNDKGFDQLHLELQQFENVHNFPFICDERRSRDLYPKARAAVDLDNYLDELTKEVRMTSDYYNRRTASRVSMGSLWFAGVASAVGFVALMFGFLGMNILDNEAICALQRGLGDSGTSHCEAALKGKIKSELATSLPPEAEKTLDRTSYVQLCRNKPLSPDTVGPDLMAVSQFVPVVKKECDNFDKTYLDALQQGYTESSRWVVVSVLMLVPAMLAMLVIFGFVTWFFARRRFRRR